MPIYEYSCKKCGVFEELKSAFSKEIRCECGEVAYLIPSQICKPHITYKENLPLGNKSRGKFIPPKGNRSGILVPSFGALEKEEVEYVAGMALEKADSEVKNKKREQKERLNKVATAAINAPRGQKGKTIRDVLGG